MYLLVLFQFLIRDLYEQLKRLHEKQSPVPFSRVYRGQLMSKEELAILKSCQGQLVSMNSFLSTSRDRNFALALVESGLHTSNELVSVLFEIDLNPYLSEMKPFADISRESAIESEDEVLLMLGSMFRLKSISSENNGLSWAIQLSLSNNDRNEISNLFDCMKIDTANDNALFSLACVLFEAGNLGMAERCYHRYLSEQPEEGVNVAKTFQSLGTIFQRRGDYDKALEMLIKAAAIFERTMPYANPFIAITHSSIGNLHLRKKNSKNALICYEKALHMFEHVHGKEHPRIAMCLNNMGAAYNQVSNIDQALACYQQALVIGEKTLPSNHPNLAASHMNVGIAFGKRNNFGLAIEHLERSLQMKMLSLPLNHPDIGDTYGNMAAVYERQKKRYEALSYYKKALSIFSATLHPTHPKIVSTKTYIERLK